MKKRVLLWLVICCFSPYLYGQEISTDIVESFQKGSAALLEPFLNEEVLLTFDDQKNKRTKGATVDQLDKFFTVSKVQSFEVKHQSMRDESGFFIGVLTTSVSKFRVHCYFKKENQNYLIHQIRIDKANE